MLQILLPCKLQVTVEKKHTAQTKAKQHIRIIIWEHNLQCVAAFVQIHSCSIWLIEKKKIILML